MKNYIKCRIQCIFSIEDCPADWCGTPDSNCLCCEYVCGLYIRKGEIFVKCNYLNETSQYETGNNS